MFGKRSVYISYARGFLLVYRELYRSVLMTLQTRIFENEPNLFVL